VVFLNGEAFAKKAVLGNVELLHSDEKVSLAEFGKAILTSAILGCEQAGAFRLELREQKAMLGLRKAQRLFAVPAVPRVNLPEHSLEATFSDLAVHLALKDKNDIYTMVHTWLRQDAMSPWNTALELVQAGMARRGLLEAVQEKKLKVFTVTRYNLPERTIRLAKGQSVGAVKALLENCERTRPEVWKELEAGIKKAITARTESGSTDLD
jgi:hypothetical protein